MGLELESGRLTSRVYRQGYWVVFGLRDLVYFVD